MLIGDLLTAEWSDQKAGGETPPAHGTNDCRLASSQSALKHFFPRDNLDRLGLGFSPLGQRDLQDALVVAGVGLLGIDCVGQAEGAGKRAIVPLDAMEVLFFLFFLELPLTA